MRCTTAYNTYHTFTLILKVDLSRNKISSVSELLQQLYVNKMQTPSVAGSLVWSNLQTGALRTKINKIFQKIIKTLLERIKDNAII